MQHLRSAETLTGTTFARADVALTRERSRRRRLATLFTVTFVPTLALWVAYAAGRPFDLRIFPSVGNDPLLYLPILLMAMLVLVVLLPHLLAGRSPHLTYRPEQIDVTFDDVKGLDGIKDEVMRTLNVFLGYATFRGELGGNPRRGLLFEGPPGTGKTYMAKAMAREAGVPFLFASGPEFQSMWQGMTARKIKKFFRTLKKTARSEGGAIGFIEEIDALAPRRGGMSQSAPAVASMRMFSPSASGDSAAAVNELLVQMQSFDEPAGVQRLFDRIKDAINLFLPAELSLRKSRPEYLNILLIACTNRGDMLDPALVRPGRFDRRLYFDLPSRAGRRELIDHFLARKRHDATLDDTARRDELSGTTFGYSPVMIEHLFDEALINALRHGRVAMTWEDVTDAKLTAEVGMPNAVSYTPAERRQIATHEAGHAVVAFLMGQGRRLEVLSIIKRRGALGLLAHSDTEERFTRTRSEMEALIAISLGGMVAEELFEGESGTGPGADLSMATQIAADMVGSLGLAGSLISYRAVESSIADPGLVSRVLSNPDTKKDVDRILKRAKRRVTTVLEANRDLVGALRDALLKRDELIGEEIVEVLERAGARAPVRSGAGRAAAAAASAAR